MLKYGLPNQSKQSRRTVILMSKFFLTSNGFSTDHSDEKLYPDNDEGTVKPHKKAICHNSAHTFTGS